MDEVKPAVFQRSVAMLRPRTNLMDSSFLFHVSQSQGFKEQLRRATNQSSQAGVYLGKLSAIEVPVLKLAEQRRIAGILDKAEALRAKRQDVASRVEAFSSALFYASFGNPASNPNKLPTTPLGELIKLKSGEFLPSAAMAESGEYPVYGGNGVNGYHDRYLFEEPKVLIGRVGAYCGCVHVTSPRSWITDNAMYVSAKEEEIEFSYLVHALKQLGLNQYASQSGQPLVSGSRIYPLKVLVPPLKL